MIVDTFNFQEVAAPAWRVDATVALQHECKGKTAHEESTINIKIFPALEILYKTYIFRYDPPALTTRLYVSYLQPRSRE